MHGFVSKEMHILRKRLKAAFSKCAVKWVKTAIFAKV